MNRIQLNHRIDSSMTHLSHAMSVICFLAIFGAVVCIDLQHKTAQAQSTEDYAQERLKPLGVKPVELKNVAPLEFGSHDVGFRYEYQIDKSRAWEPWPFADDEKPRTTKRPVRIAVWYPAKVGTSKKMMFKDYVDPKHADAYFSKLNEVMFKYDMWSYKGMMKGSEEAIQKLLSLETHSHRDADVQNGKFPVVLYCSGWFSRSPDNAHVCEFLASHGYVVVTVPQLGTGSTTYDFLVTEERIRTQVDDLGFALAAVKKWGVVDDDRVAAMGFSGGGIVALWLSQIEDKISAVIGLDPSYAMKDFLTVSESGIHAEKSGFPILTLYRGHKRQLSSVSLELIKNLKWANHFVVEVPDATHGEFYDEPYLLSRLDLEWPRKEYNSHAVALKRYYSTARLVKSFLDQIGQENGTKSEELKVKMENLSKSIGFRQFTFLSNDQ